MTNSKPCKRCGQIKPLDSYYASKKAIDGEEGVCIDCRKASNKANYQKNKDAVNQRARIWGEINADKKREFARLWRRNNPESRRSWVANNREKTRSYTKQFRQKNPEYNAIQSSRRRARILGTRKYDVTLKQIKKLYQQPCLYCGAPAEHIDHIIPLSRSGEHRIGNLAPACKRCNLSKGNKFVTEWKRGKDV